MNWSELCQCRAVDKIRERRGRWRGYPSGCVRRGRERSDKHEAKPTQDSCIDWWISIERVRKGMKISEKESFHGERKKRLKKLTLCLARRSGGIEIQKWNADGEQEEDHEEEKKREERERERTIRRQSSRLLQDSKTHSDQCSWL